ncbi:Transketolase, N-terminal section [hydrothermal vent metagenome]|uniref:Transketolase, N-terminal section n=1 Tax=hydrothermal vent metagenome TaxID=652676 RepID=A0A3B1D4S7_9ZZZZ
MIDSSELLFAPYKEIERIINLDAPMDDVAQIFADVCRLNTLYMISFAGSGHVGSSLSSLDIVSHLYLQRMNNPGEEKGDIYFSSKGHDAPGLYAALIGLGLLPFDNIDQLRKLGGLPGHPDVGTPHIVTNTGSLGMGVSKAKGMAMADRLKGRERKYYLLLGDGELQEGQFWESLLPASNGNFGMITAIVDHNKLQSDTFVSEVSDLGDLEKRFEVHGWAVARCDGHDIGAIREALDSLEKNRTAPKILIADTIKAKGGGRMESTNFTVADRLYDFHSGAPAAGVYVEAVEALVENINRKLNNLGAKPLTCEKKPRPAPPEAPENQQKLIGAYSEVLLANAEANSDLVVLDGDLALDCGLIPFEKRFPGRFFECGIAEQDMVSMAGGMALKGLLPVVHSFACFLATRANEQIFNNSTERTKIIYVGSLAGVLPGGPGHSHQSIHDIAALSGLSGFEMIEPCCEAEVKMALDYAVKEAKTSVYIRLVSIPVDIPYRLPADYRFKPGVGAELAPGDDALIIGYGPVCLPQAVKASSELSKKGVGVKVINLPWLNQVDAGWLQEISEPYKVIVTIDNHHIEGGQGRFIRSELAAIAFAENKKIVSLGIDVIAKCGGNNEVLKAHGLDFASIVDSIEKALQ